MSEVKRYWMDGEFFAGTWTVAMKEETTGEYVRYSDYQALLQELTNLQQPAESPVVNELLDLLKDQVEWAEENVDLVNRKKFYADLIKSYRKIRPKEGQANVKDSDDNRNKPAEGSATESSGQAQTGETIIPCGVKEVV